MLSWIIPTISQKVSGSDHSECSSQSTNMYIYRPTDFENSIAVLKLKWLFDKTESSSKHYTSSMKHLMVWLSSASLTCSLARTQSGLLGHQVKVFICIPRSRGSEGASRYCAPNLWNKLPADLRSITTLSTLKTNAESTTSTRPD